MPTLFAFWLRYYLFFKFNSVNQDALFGIRDRLGMRPLCLGSIANASGTKYVIFFADFVTFYKNVRLGVGIMCPYDNWSRVGS